MSRPRISVITPSYNQVRYIGRTIRSVLEQEGDFDLEYRVIDGGSTDGTLDLLAGFGNRITWTSERDEGQIDAINRGLRVATGDIVGWLNSDDLLLPGALAKIVASFEAHPEAEWVHGRCEIIDEHDRPVRRWVSLYKHWMAKRHTFERLLGDNYICQITTFWRRSVQEQIGYLDPELTLAFDYEYWVRLAKRGAPAYVPERLACFRWYDTSKSGANYVEQFRENTEIAIRHAPPGSRGLLLRKRAKNAVYARLYRMMSSHRGTT
jgi:glycosyltransferase involved in cell wall biosynthesis